MARSDEEAPWTRQLLVAVGALAAVALVIGGVVSVVALGAAEVTGLADPRPTATARPSLYLPEGEPTTRVEPYPEPQGGPSASASPSARPSSRATRKPVGIELRATPSEVAAGERITLSGSYRGRDGARLQVQRFQGGWVDFPVETTASGGVFSTYIITSRTGVNRLRMKVTDPVGGGTSGPVEVTVR